MFLALVANCLALLILAFGIIYQWHKILRFATAESKLRDRISLAKVEPLYIGQYERLNKLLKEETPNLQTLVEAQIFIDRLMTNFSGTERDEIHSVLYKGTTIECLAYARKLLL